MPAEHAPAGGDRRQPSEPPIRLGSGRGLTLSPDGKWALAALKASARWLPDGKRFVLCGSEKTKRSRLYLLDISGKVPRAVTPEGARQAFAVSPDGTLVAARVVETLGLYPVEGGEAREVPGQSDGERAIAWAAVEGLR